jgi:VIT1/CCC1 family predicted Fe2+/Mn2+ transporter
MSRPQPATRAAPPSAPAAIQRTNKMAIWSLVLSIITLGGLGSLAGIALGLAARSKITQTGERGHGLALAGIIIGVVTLVAAIAYWVIIAMHTGGAGGGGGSGGGGGY